MQMCPFCDNVYDESEYSKCPYCHSDEEDDDFDFYEDDDDFDYEEDDDFDFYEDDDDDFDYEEDCEDEKKEDDMIVKAILHSMLDRMKD